MYVSLHSVCICQYSDKNSRSRAWKSSRFDVLGERCSGDCRCVKLDKIVVEKSTVHVKTAEAIEKNAKGINFQILSNPGFLAE
jgi:UDP-glucose 6-dehydrogenase